MFINYLLISKCITLINYLYRKKKKKKKKPDKHPPNRVIKTLAASNGARNTRPLTRRPEKHAASLP